MNDQDRAAFDPRIADWLEGDPNTAPEPTLQIVLAAFPSIRQRHAMRLPWRFPSMSTMPKLALGAAAVIAVVLGGSVSSSADRSSTASAVPQPDRHRQASPRRHPRPIAVVTASRRRPSRSTGRPTPPAASRTPSTYPAVLVPDPREIRLAHDRPGRLRRRPSGEGRTDDGCLRSDAARHLRAG